MNNAGNPEAHTPEPETDDESRPAWWLLPLIGVVLLVLMMVGTQAFGVLYAILFPPTAPLPVNATEITCESASYGLDTCEYSLAQPGCEVAQFYSERGVCLTMADACSDDESSEAILQPGQAVADCQNTLAFSQFIMRWRAQVSANFPDADQTHLVLGREIFWGGRIPPDMNEIMDQIRQTPAAP